MIRSKYFIYLAFIALFYLFFSGSSFANLMLREPSVNLFLKQGQKFKGGIVLENISSKDLRVSAASVTSFDKNGNPEKRSSSNMLKLDKNSFVIPAKNIYVLRYSVDIPKDANGGYWSSIIYTYYGGSMPGPEGITFNFKMHDEAPVNISVLDTAQKKLAIKKIEAVYSEGITLEIKSSVKNIGNIFEEVKPVFLILDPDGKLLYSLKANTFKAYPSHEYSIDLRKELKIEKGRNKLIGIFDFGADEILTIEKELLIN